MSKRSILVYIVAQIEKNMSNAPGLFVATMGINSLNKKKENDMSVDDLKTRAPDDPLPEKEEKKSPLKAIFIMAGVAVGAIFLLKKFKGKFPNKGDEPMVAP